MSKSEDLVRRFFEAERLEKRSHPEVPERKWLRAKCSYCGYKFQYEPKSEWTGELKCPHCGKKFTISRLDDWVP